MHRARLLFLIVPWALLQSSFSQTRAAPAVASAVVGAAPRPFSVNLGESSVALDGPWKFHTGDDMAWSRTDFDDSKWATLDLTPPLGPGDANIGESEDIPGWTSAGYPGYSGFAWYRLKVNVQGAARRLAIKMPDDIDDAYQVFVEGKEIGSFGKFTKHDVTAYPSLPEQFSLPKGIRDGTITIAIRAWMDSATRFNSPDAGGLHGPPILGYASFTSALNQRYYYEFAHQYVSVFLEWIFVSMAMLMALALFWLDREEKAYLWLALVCLETLLSNSIVISVNLFPWIGQTTAVLLRDVLLSPMRIGLWVLFWGYWFRISRIARLHQLVWTLVGILMIGTAMLRPPLYGEHVPVHFAAIINPALVLTKLALGALLFLVTYLGLKREKREGWLAFSAVLLIFVANYQREMHLFHIPIGFPVLGIEVPIGAIATVVSLLLITIMPLIRFFRSQRQKEIWKLEIQQAQQVQQILIPNKLPDIPGFTIDSEYRPAREVGGDFFQVLPGDVPGSAIIVVGDVTGKGMQAGMLVAVIVGALRASALHSSDPVQMMHEVNVQLCERQHASATCQILYLDPLGNATLANAGQLPPYLNGKEMEMEGALPLGTIPDAEHSVTNFILNPGDSIIMMSDGIVEAQDAQGNLLGFERINELLRNSTTAEEIAKAAQDFGQEDDILVLQVRRNQA